MKVFRNQDFLTASVFCTRALFPDDLDTIAEHMNLPLAGFPVAIVPCMPCLLLDLASFEGTGGSVCADGVITSEVADKALSSLEVDKLGLDAIDRRMLKSIIDYYGGGPVGLETLAATINEEAVTIEDVYEPYLLQCGFLTRTPRGRCVTRRAYEHLGLEYLGQQQIEM